MTEAYDEIGLVKPAEIDPLTGYRIYTHEQSKYIGWINILKNLDFSLTEIKKVLDGSIDSAMLIQWLKQKRIDIHARMNSEITKKVQIDTFIHILEKEGFSMDKKINLMEMSFNNVNEIKKYA